MSLVYNNKSNNIYLKKVKPSIIHFVPRFHTINIQLEDEAIDPLFHTKDISRARSSSNNVSRKAHIT